MSFRKLLVFIFLCNTQLLLTAQITITNADMPNVNDEVLYSVKQTLPNFNASLTGPDYKWDYTSLIPDSQRVEKIVSPASTGYPFVGFITTYAMVNNNPDLFPYVLLGSTPTNNYNFYKKSATQLVINVQGSTTGTTAIPIIQNPVDVVYKFPLTYGNKDSSNSGYKNVLPGFGYFEKKQKRVNTVDGWGELKTPYGTFNTIRVKSVITVVDSIFIDSLGFGFSIPLPTRYEFKWLANGSKLPVLEIDAAGVLNLPIMTVDNVLYQDSVIADLAISLTPIPTCPLSKQGAVQTVIQGGRYPYTFKWSNGSTAPAIDNLAPGTYSVTVTDKYGKEASGTATVETTTDDLACLNIPNGFTPDNDGVNDVWNIRGLNRFAGCKVDVFTQWGAVVFSSKGYNEPWEGKYNNQPVEAGTYYYRIDLGNDKDVFTGTLTIIK